MKNNYLIITSFLLIFFSTKIAAQGTLQFNQVITQAANTPYTVPVGKVFKLEAITSNTSGYYVTAGPLTLSIAGITYAGGNSAQSWAWPFPIWLKAGDIIQSSGGGSGVAISGIEFNIIP